MRSNQKAPPEGDRKAGRQSMRRTRVPGGRGRWRAMARTRVSPGFLRAISAEDFLKGGRGGGPVIDGWFLPEDVGKIFAEGKQNDVPLLSGSNKDEANPSDFKCMPFGIRVRQFDIGSPNIRKATPAARK